MITVHVNPPAIQDEYLRCLNTVFGNWGDAEKYFWYFQRKTSFPDPDLMVLKERDRTLAGSAVSYRQIRFPNGGDAVIGIMTGSWTLPEARNAPQCIETDFGALKTMSVPGRCDFWQALL